VSPSFVKTMARRYRAMVRRQPEVPRCVELRAWLDRRHRRQEDVPQSFGVAYAIEASNRSCGGDCRVERNTPRKPWCPAAGHLMNAWQEEMLQ
jgi:hypothetical protein